MTRAATHTLGNQVDRIADELARGDLTTQIILEYKSAISFYETMRNWNNETRLSTSLTASTNAEFTDLPTSRPVIDIDMISINETSGEYELLERRPYAWFEQKQAGGITGEPTHFCVYGNQIRWYPIPDDSYTMMVSGIFEDSSTLTSTACSTFWTYGLASDLIRARTKAAIQINYLGDQLAKQEMMLMAQTGKPFLCVTEMNYYNALWSRVVNRLSSGFVEPDTGMTGNYGITSGYAHPERL
jgi:hypothetical protein